MLSYRRDAEDKDYPNAKYEEFLMPQERHAGNPGLEGEHHHLFLGTDTRVQTVLMERTYLNGWQVFMKKTADLLPHLADMITSSDKDDINGQLRALGALSVCKFSAHSLRDAVIRNCKDIIQRGETRISIAAVTDGLIGLGGCTYQPPQTQEILRQILDMAEPQVAGLTVNEAIALLHGIHMSGHASLNERLVKKAFAIVDSLHMDRPYNELTYAELGVLREIYTAAKQTNNNF